MCLDLPFHVPAINLNSFEASVTFSSFVCLSDVDFSSITSQQRVY